ncbi:hypothetical protein LR48_Vigan01g043400 [Vigna angularis]|uniref:Uncharacterized protein n=1 Tax=Phaseolus angularis TaxID=3914 RepID=A0A0L9TL48_PHAAN|nr:hypothetical protein LR48_Vigan01g043400 [Vigna angularis]
MDSHSELPWRDALCQCTRIANGLVAMREIQSSWSLSRVFARRVRSLCEKLMVSLCEGVRYARGTF